MRYTLAIDVPSLCLAKKNVKPCINPLLVIDVLDILIKRKLGNLLFRDEIFSLIDWEQDTSRLIYNMLSLLSMEYYSKERRKDSLTIIPKLCDIQFSDEINDEIYLQACVLHQHENKELIWYITFQTRWDGKVKKLQTIRDGKSREYETSIVADIKDFKTGIDNKRPILGQLKHSDKGRIDSKGQIVSPFSSYDQRNPEYAETLLQTAFDDYIGNEEFPDYLYTWDKKAECYVEFRYSGNRLYHGFDLKQKEYGKVFVNRYVE